MSKLPRFFEYRPSGPTCAGIVAVAVLASIGPAALAAPTAGQDPVVTIPSSPLPQRDWVDPDGKLLPFYADDDERLKEFLRTAEIVDTEDIPVGVTDPIRVKLRDGNTEVHAVFRYVDTVYDRVRMQDGKVRVNLRDSCHFEAAAYELSQLLGMDSVPPTVSRKIGDRDGSLQIWVYDAIMEGERLEQEKRSPDPLGWIRQVHAMYLFDALIGNDDRTQQNLLIDENWRIWLIDHTRAFYARAESPNLEKVTFVESGFWEGLQALNKEVVEEAVGDHLSSLEIEQLLERRDRVARHIEGLLETRPREAVFYQWTPPGR